jgi:hypothetical protein
MRRLSSFFLRLSLLLASLGLSAQPLDFVLDLDSTLIFLPPRAGDEVIVAAGKSYGMAPGSGAFLQSLSKLPEARVSFFSAYPLAKRNNEALEAIRLPDGRSARELAFRVLHGTRVKRASKSEDPVALQPLFKVFWGDIKKDLSLVAADLDLARAVLFDDTHTNAHRDQERSLLWLHNHSADGELARARGLVDAALEKAEIDDRALTDALWSLQWRASGPHDVAYVSESANDVDLYRKGAALLKAEDPDYAVSKQTLRSVRQSPDIKNPPRPESPFVRRFGT